MPAVTDSGDTKKRQIDAGKEAAIEAEVKAARERAVIPLEIRMKQFRDMLAEKEVSVWGACLRVGACSECGGVGVRVCVRGRMCGCMYCVCMYCVCVCIVYVSVSLSWCM